MSRVWTSPVATSSRHTLRKLGAVFEERLASLPAHGVGVKQVGRQRHNDGRRHVGHAKHRQRAGVDILEGGPNVEIRVTTHLRDELPGAELGCHRKAR